MTALRPRAKRAVWDLLPIRLIHRLGLAGPELRAYRLDHLIEAVSERRGLPGSIVEIGCYRGGTTLAVNRALRSWGDERRYVCVDTFDGFIERQFEPDRRRGTLPRLRHAFDVTSRSKVERILRSEGFEGVELITADVVELPDFALPDEICVCLMDVDLAEPTLAGLRKVHPRLVAGGLALVDDCGPGGSRGHWKARDGYARFCEETGIAEDYRHGFGVVNRA